MPGHYERSLGLSSCQSVVDPAAILVDPFANFLSPFTLHLPSLESTLMTGPFPRQPVHYQTPAHYAVPIMLGNV